MTSGKERIIYNNYDLWEDYENARNSLIREYGMENPTDEDIIYQVYEWENDEWNFAAGYLQDFFNENPFGYIIFGTVGRWNGRYDGGEVFTDWQDLTERVDPWKDCDYLKIYDVNGHLYIKCSHHDGTNYYEIKELTERGREVYDNWECYSGTGKDYSEREIHNVIINNNFFSRLPHFANRVYGWKRKEYKEQSV